MSEIVPKTGKGWKVAGSGLGGKTAEGCGAISYAPSGAVAFGGGPLARPSAAKSGPKPGAGGGVAGIPKAVAGVVRETPRGKA